MDQGVVSADECYVPQRLYVSRLVKQARRALLVGCFVSHAAVQSNIFYFFDVESMLGEFKTVVEIVTEPWRSLKKYLARLY